MITIWLTIVFCVTPAAGQAPANGPSDECPYTRTVDVIYGRKYGTALTMDVFTPTNTPNGAAVIWAVSGGWISAHEGISPKAYATLLRHGYTVFAVVHGSQPKYTIPEVLQDMNRAVRFIRMNSQRFHIDPNRIGIAGGSAGGHLSLMIGLAPQDGKPDHKDPVMREPSRVQAVACFFPPTDFLNYGKPGRDTDQALREELKPFSAPFDFQRLDKDKKMFVPITNQARRLEIFRQISPVTHVSSDDPPTLIIHGDADKLVPIQQSQLLMDKLKAAGVTAELIIKNGAKHGWPGLHKDIEIFADWFDTHLRKTPTTSRPH